MVGIEQCKELVRNVFGVAKIVIKTIKAAPAIQAEVKDLDLSESTSLIVQVVVEEIPAVLEEIRK